MKHPFNILVVEDDVATGKVVVFNLKEKGYNAHFFKNAEEGLLYFQQNPVDLVLVDYKLPGMSGEEFFKKARELNPLTPVIFITAMQSVDKAVELLKMGAYTYLTKPLKMETLLHNIQKALENIQVVKESQRLQETLEQSYSFENYVFQSEKMKRILQLALRVAGSEANVLITGESGTGKDVLAHIIHYSSHRKNQNFVKVNLASLPETLIEAELFGAKKGAYTGSVENRTGKFEEADKGTLFLDEIGELSMPVQVKLLRVIQDREVTRLGSNKPVKIDLRLITATNKNLEEAIRENGFREDLFYRLNVIDIHLPPLRERKEDIPQLVEYFIGKYSHREGKAVHAISTEALDALIKYHFPGNIRELENIIERALVLCISDVIGINELPVFIGARANLDTTAIETDNALPLPERLTAIEKTILVKALEKHGYHQTKTADELGISEARLRYKLKTLGIQKKKI